MTGVWADADGDAKDDAWDDDGGYIPFTPEPDLKESIVEECPGVELNPNLCTCPCYGCKHHCGAHHDPTSHTVEEECPEGVHSMFDFCPGRDVCEGGYDDGDTDDDTDPCP